MNHMKKSLALLIAVSALTNAGAAHAQIPVVDPANIAQTVKVVQQSVQQVAQLKEQLSQLTAMQKTIGSIGKSAVSGMLKDAGLDFADPTKMLTSQFRSAMPGLLDALPTSKIGGTLGIDNLLAGKAKTNIQDGRNFALSTFYKAGEATVDELSQRKGLRQAAMRDAVTSGYAVAVYTKNDIANAEDRLKKLSEKAAESSDLRADVQSNTAVALATLQAVTVQNTLLAQMLEVNSTAAMASDATTPFTK